jgi:flagellar assembly protein FliH
MTKVVFRNGEIAINNSKVFLDTPQHYAEQDAVEETQVEEVVEEYTGPTVDDLKQEAEAFKRHWDAEKESMLLAAKIEAENITKAAEETAFQEVKRKTVEAQALKQQAQDEAERILAEAQQKAGQMKTEATRAIEGRQREAEEQGRSAGYTAGFQEGKAEVDRLIERTRVVLERVQERRGEILVETEQQIIDLALLVSRKVVKVISESQKEVVIANVSEALKKVKGRGTVIIRVNTADLQLSTEHVKDFIQQLEGSSAIQVQEDFSIDQGGCIIETDFGEIDARISSQLAELEAKIREITPVKARPLDAEGEVADGQPGT